MNTNLQGKTALVTGASRGIGAAIAKRLASQGANILLHYGNSQAAAQAVADDIRQAGVKVSLVQADFAKSDAASALKAQLAHDQVVDILVNNAGVAPFADLQSTTPEIFDQLANINMRSLFFVTQAVLPRMPDGGRIVNLSTAVTRVAFDGILAYAASKGFVDVFTLHLATQLAKRRITVNAVAPGAIDTEMSAWIHQPGGSDALNAIQALPGIGKPEHVAALVAYLASEDAAWTTGRTIDVSGGTKL
jgi:3-oxoacyl-[acyl-carrier protein] reductase